MKSYFGLKSYFCEVNLTLGKFGPHPALGVAVGGKRGSINLMGVSGKISNRKLKFIS